MELPHDKARPSFNCPGIICRFITIVFSLFFFPLGSLVSFVFFIFPLILIDGGDPSATDNDGSQLPTSTRLLHLFKNWRYNLRDISSVMKIKWTNLPVSKFQRTIRFLPRMLFMQIINPVSEVSNKYITAVKKAIHDHLKKY